MNYKQQEHYAILVKIASSHSGKVISDCYERNNVKMEFECRNNHRFFSTPDSVKHNRWCPSCNRVSPKEAKDRCMEIIRSKGGRIISDYINTKTKITIECGQGHQWSVTPSSIMHCDSWCPKCSKFDHQAEEELYQLIGQRGGSVKEKYVNTRTRMIFTCKKGHTWQAAPQDIKRGTWCALCSFKFDEMKEALNEIVRKKGGKVEGEYINNRTWMKFTCDKGHQWEAQVFSVKTGTWCPSCQRSVGEEKIADILRDLKIDFVEQFRHPLLPARRYDFYFEYKGVKYLLEFDGRQHFDYEGHFHRDEEDFLYRQEIDRIKTYVGVLTKHVVIRISYLEINSIVEHIETALTGKEWCYFSNPNLYQEWLINQDVSDEILYQECPQINTL